MKRNTKRKGGGLGHFCFASETKTTMSCFASSRVASRLPYGGASSVCLFTLPGNVRSNLSPALPRAACVVSDLHRGALGRADKGRFAPKVCVSRLICFSTKEFFPLWKIHIH